MEFLGDFFETFLEGSVDLIIYRDHIVNRRFFLFTVVWPVTTITEVRNQFEKQNKIHILQVASKLYHKL